MNVMKLLSLYFVIQTTIYQSIGLQQSLDGLIEVINDESSLLPSVEEMVLASTLDGSLIALDQRSGNVFWKLDDQPIVKSSYDSNNPSLPAFLPDPKDGSLYMLGLNSKDPLKKLPFTIPELVAASPCKSSDGILYTGKKIDSWFTIDKLTGDKLASLSIDGCMNGNGCPNTYNNNYNTNNIFIIGRTEYTILIYDTRTSGHYWNVSFFEYSGKISVPSIHKKTQSREYDWIHFTDSSSGSLMTLNRKTSSLQWSNEMKSPIVGMYKLEGETMVPISFTSVSKDTLEHLIDSLYEFNHETYQKKKLFPSLYVGEHDHGLFAFPALIQENTNTLYSQERPLIEGPLASELNSISKCDLSLDLKFRNMNSRDSVALCFGYYKVPTQHKTPISSLSNRLTLAGNKGLSLPEQHKFVYSISSSEKEINFSTWILSKEIFNCIQNIDFLTLLQKLILTIENKELKIIILLLVLALFMVTRFLQKHAFYGDSQRLMNQYSTGSLDSNSSHSGSTSSTASPIHLGNGNIKVGNITFNEDEILGKGCEGTFVFKGRFDGRHVAVKRVLGACFTIADREVNLLREADEHSNVIRYYCMEQDSQFRYIALEYCAANLQDFVEGKYINKKINSISLLRQITNGIHHLHSLDIVHRDIKPHNILLSSPSSKGGEVRAMISDFGLCKKLKIGRMSFSRRSGIAGTEGWIAPEMMNGNPRATAAVDIFSLGCCFYYILTKGSHPFGESVRRQFNILRGSYNLKALETSQESLFGSCIEHMISHEMNNRPSTSAILIHPVFWSKEKILNFFTAVSDRIDKENNESILLERLEKNKFGVYKGDWFQDLEPLISADLRRHRSYNGNSLRDLLRALRNKRNHFLELSNDIKSLYGEMPEKFANYWLIKFPNLLIHTWIATQTIKHESIMTKYYDKDYDFIQKISMEASEEKKEVSSFQNSCLKQDSFSNVVPHRIKVKDAQDPFFPSIFSNSPKTKRRRKKINFLK